jgi:D-glycero-beta-D-manno-heptose-7-phosphate kinase
MKGPMKYSTKRPTKQKPRETATRDRLERLVKAFAGKCLVVLGDWMLDRYVWGTAARLSPEAAVPVVDFTKQSGCLGGAGNVAANLVALGARVFPFGITGDDQPAGELRACVRAMQMGDKGLLVDTSRPTTLKTRIMARNQQVVRVDRESRAPLNPEIASKLVARILAALRDADLLVISDYDKGVVSDEVSGRVLNACQRLNVPVLVKPKWSRLPVYRGASAIVCNRAEAGFLVTRNLETQEDVEEAGRALLAHFGCPAVMITRGERGMSVIEQDQPAGFHIAATSQERESGLAETRQSGPGRQVFDVTGAGDTVLATLALAVAAGATMREGAVLGNAAAGVVVSKLGTATLTPRELLDAIREMPGTTARR